MAGRRITSRPSLSGSSSCRRLLLIRLCFAMVVTVMVGRGAVRGSFACAFRTASSSRLVRSTTRYRIITKNNAWRASYNGVRPFTSLSAHNEENTIQSTTTTIVVGESSPILQDLNPNQIDAVTQPVTAITRVVAGPGSGKTRVLTSRIAYLLEATQHDRILGVTFTRKAAGEMQQRVHKLLAETAAAAQDDNDNDNDEELLTVEGGFEPFAANGMNRVTLGTFHSVCAKILRWNGDLLSTLPSVNADMRSSRNETVLTGTFNIADQSEQLRLLKETYKDNVEIETIMKSQNIKPLQILNKICWIKSELHHGEKPFPKDGQRRVPWSLQIAAKLYYPYREKLLSSNCIDFDDLILLTRELLLHNEDICDRLRRRWKHVLIDEFQDTSRTQLDLVKLLTSDSLLVVGDADQSIYSWRGAHVGSLSDFEKEFAKYSSSSEGVSTVYLMENYRSTSNIVKAAQRIISSTGDETSGADKLRQAMIPKRSSGKPPRIVACEDGLEEGKHLRTAQWANVTVEPFCLLFVYLCS